MFRAFTAASIFVLTVTTTPAGAATIVGVPQTANDVCGSLLQSKPSSLFYQTWFKTCMHSTSIAIARRADARLGQYRAFASR